jgi:hypothetical protein
MTRYEIGYTMEPSEIGQWVSWADPEAEITRLREELNAVIVDRNDAIEILRVVLTADINNVLRAEIEDYLSRFSEGTEQ